MQRSIGRPLEWVTHAGVGERKTLLRSRLGCTMTNRDKILPLSQLRLEDTER